MPHISFPARFVWGAATSAYQIEGACNEDGKGPSIWDTFCRMPGKIDNSATGEITCDHYHHWQEDIAWMKALNLQAYRFSIAWPRILPQGRGDINPSGLDFYDRLVDGLLEAGIQPYATLYHWDLPQALQDAGGWTERCTAEAFTGYTDAVTRCLGDRVKHWMTINEPWVSAFLGHERGVHAPGWQDTGAAVRAAHHLLLAHGWSVPLIRRNSPGAQVGIALDIVPTEPASPSFADELAARREDGLHNRWFLDPLFGRSYPTDIVDDFCRQQAWPEALIQPGDMQAIAVPVDFLGINYYTRAIVRASIPESDNLPPTNQYADPSEWMEGGWADNYPQGLYNLLTRLRDDYPIPPIYITENGASYNDAPDAQGCVNDTRRIAYIESHLQHALRAAQSGVPLAGYFVWSLFDNFEWARGYTMRFGLVWVDYTTQQRIPKASALWYRDGIAAWRAHHHPVA
ncbi:MAG: beta-glucosidase [Anaerolineae bacterium]|nr:beta-glucosidase [Anaerolineae bacterium]